MPVLRGLLIVSEHCSPITGIHDYHCNTLCVEVNVCAYNRCHIATYTLLPRDNITITSNKTGASFSCLEVEVYPLQTLDSFNIKFCNTHYNVMCNILCLNSQTSDHKSMTA